MSKRILSLVLALVMLVLAVPVFALPTLAAEADPTIKFAVGPTGTTGLNTVGTVVKETTVSKKGYPTPADIEKAGVTLDLDEVIGWYAYDKETDEFYSVKAYYGGYMEATDGLTFYPITKTTYMQGYNSGRYAGANQPLWTATPPKTDGNDTAKYVKSEIKTYTGGWVLGAFENQAFLPFTQAGDTAYAIFTTKVSTEHNRVGGYYPLSGNISIQTYTDRTGLSNFAAAYAFSAVASGTVKITIPAADKANCVLAIVKNDAYVWPSAIAGKTASAASAEKESWGALKYAAITAIYQEANITDTLTLDVQAGDRIYFMLANTAAASQPYFYPTVSYTNITDVPVYDGMTTSFLDNRPALDGANGDPIPYVGNWDYITYTSQKLAGGAPLAKYHKPSGEAWFLRENDSNYNTFEIYASNPNTEAKTDIVSWRAYALGAEAGKVIGTRYTAPYTGSIKVSFDRLLNSQLFENTHKQVTEYAIFVNGEKVWPVNDTDDWYTVSYYSESVPDKVKEGDTNVIGTLNTNYADTLNATMPGEIEIEAGQTVEFLMHAVNVYEYSEENGLAQAAYRYASRWGGNYVDGIVTYTKAYPAPTVEAGVRVGGELSIYGQTSNTVPYNGYGVYLNGEKISMNEYYNTQFEVKVAAADADKIQTVQPYYILNGKEIKGKAYEITLNEILGSYADSEDASIAAAADATLKYTAAADVYFNGEATEIPEVAAPKNHDDYVAKGDSIGAVQCPEENKQVEFRGISLLLNDLINIKIVVNGTLPEGASLQIATNENFTTPETVEGKATSDGTGTKFVMEGISAKNWNTDYYVRVVDASGKAISDTLCYSVAAYYGRMIDRAEATDELKAVIKSLMNLYEAVSAN